MIDLWKKPRHERTNVRQRIEQLKRKIADCDNTIAKLELWFSGCKENKIEAQKELDKIYKEYNITP